MGRSSGSGGPFLFLSLRTSWVVGGQDAVNRRRLTLNRRRLTLNRRRLTLNRRRLTLNRQRLALTRRQLMVNPLPWADDGRQSLAGWRSAEV